MSGTYCPRVLAAVMIAAVVFQPRVIGARPGIRACQRNVESSLVGIECRCLVLALPSACMNHLYLQSPSTTLFSNRRVSVIVGALSAIAIHVLVLSVTLLGSSASKTRSPELHGPGASAIAADAEPTMTVVFLQMPGISSEQDVEAVASHGTTPQDSTLTTASPDPTPAADLSKADHDEHSPASVDAGDPAARAALFGLYSGQIDARIKRAWRRPRSPITVSNENPILASMHAAANNDSKADEKIDEVFRCQVRLYQDNQGNIKEVELMSCNGSRAWQQSLLTAINHASPLPAPP
jgi:TonB C terminal